PLGLRLDRSSPMVDARLPDGSRLHAVLPPVAVDGTCVAIRRFGAGRRGLDDFGAAGELARLLRWAVRAGWNLLLSGGTGAGKTSPSSRPPTPATPPRPAPPPPTARPTPWPASRAWSSWPASGCPWRRSGPRSAPRSTPSSTSPATPGATG